MKIAIAGKGGTGKTTTTTLLVTYLQKTKHILALDADSNENLAESLGFPEKDIHSMNRLRYFMDQVYGYTKTDLNWETRHLTPHPHANYYIFKNGKMDDFLRNITLTKDKVSVGHLGTVEEAKRGIQSMCGSYGLMRVFLNHLQEGKNDVVLVDLPAGNELLTRATVMNMDEVLLIVEPTAKNLTVAKDIMLSLKILHFDHVYCIVNKSFKKTDIEYVSKELRIKPSQMRRIPFSTQILELDNAKELSFDNAPVAAQKTITDIFSLMSKHPIDNNKLLKRAAMIDQRLFPDENARLTEQQHN